MLAHNLYKSFQFCFRDVVGVPGCKYFHLHASSPLKHINALGHQIVVVLLVVVLALVLVLVVVVAVVVVLVVVLVLVLS